jgi:hypothetical protein
VFIYHDARTFGMTEVHLQANMHSTINDVVWRCKLLNGFAWLGSN